MEEWATLKGITLRDHDNVLPFEEATTGNLGGFYRCKEHARASSQGIIAYRFWGDPLNGHTG